METIATFLGHYKHIDKVRNINEILFTIREIDVLSCLINGRSTKKIASLLFISPKTVEVHIRNIMSKIGCSSREKLIDFIESSESHLAIKGHYRLILGKNHFKIFLKSKEGLALSPNKVVSILHQESVSEESLILINVIKEILAEFNIKSSISLLNDPKFNESYTVYVVTNEIEEKNLIVYLEAAGTKPNDVIFCFNFSSEILSNKKIYNALFINNNSPFYLTILELLIAMNISKNFLTVKHSFERAFRVTDRENETPFISEKNDNFKVLINNLNNELETVRYGFPRKFKKFIFFVATMFFVVMVFGFYFYNNTNKGYIRVQMDLELPENEIFIKRGFLLKKINDVFKKDENKIKQLIIVGIGGIGKTIIARSYAMQQTNNIFWEINSENEMEIIKSFERLAVVLARNKEEREELDHLHMLNNIDYLKTKLISIVQNQLHDKRDWLLIYDNVDNINDIIQYLPRSENVWGEGKILITTRNQNIVDSQYINRKNVIYVPELNAEEKKTLFLKICYPDTIEMKKLIKKDFPNENLQKFLNKLPSYPLDVNTAAYFLKNTKMEYEKYLDNIDKPDAVLKTLGASFLKNVDYNFNTRYNIVITTIKKIIAHDPDFKYKLFEVGLLSSNGIPFALLEKNGENGSVIPFIRELARYSLVSYNNTINVGNISLHRSIHNIIYLYLTNILEPQVREKYIKNLSERISSKLNVALNKEEINKVKSIVSNAEEFIKKVPSYSDNEINPLRYQIGRAYRYLGRFKEATAMLEGIINFDKNIDILLELGTIYINEGKYNKAIFLIEKALNLARKEYGSDSIQVARAEIRLDTPYRKVKKYHEAKKLLEHSLAIHNNYQNIDPGDIAWIYTKLGYLTVKLGHANEAIELFNKSLNIQLPLYGPDSIRTAWTQVRMAHAYKDLHKYDLAENMLKNSLKVYQRHFGKNHLKTAWVLCFVGEIEGLLGHFKQAETDLQEGLEIQKKYHGENHIRTAWALNKLAEFYRRANMISKANYYAELCREASSRGDEEKH